MQVQTAFFIDRADDDERLEVCIEHDKMGQMNFKEGQPIKIISTSTNKSVVARVFTSRSPCPPSSIKMGFTLRRNLCAYLGQSVVIEGISDLKTAEIVTVSCIAETVEGIDGSLLDILLASNYEFMNFPVQKGMILPVYALNRVIEFIVTSCSPEDVVLIQDKDSIAYKNQVIHRTDEQKAFPLDCVHYSSIGALDKEIKEIRKYIELPLVHGNLFQTFGLKGTSGILITGKSGTGKTYLSQAIRNETPCYFEYLKCLDLLTKTPNESSFILRRFTDRAIERAPSIMFIDDIDLICEPQYLNENVTDQHLSQSLLSAIDRCVSQTNVVIICTSKTDQLPKDFIRGRRLDKIIKLKEELTNEERFSVILCAIRSTLISSATNPQEFIPLTEGLTAGEIALTIRRALTHRAMDIAKSINDDDEESIPIEVLQTLVVGKKRFTKALPKADNSEFNPDDPFAGKPINDQQKAFANKLYGKKSNTAPKQMAFDPAQMPGAQPNDDDPFADIQITRKADKTNDDDPFSDIPKKNNANNNTNNDDPFAITTPAQPKDNSSTSQADDPFGFGAPAKPQNTSSTDPFGAPPAKADNASPATDPFGAAPSSKSNDDPFATNKPQIRATNSDILGGNDDIFGNSKPASNDPFAPKPKASPSNDPFGNIPAAPSSNDPFGISKPEKKAADSSDPFGNAPAAPPSNDPFGGDPFGTQPQKSSQPSDPFGNAPAASSSNDPFATNNQQQQQKSSDPFGGDPFGNQQQKAAPSNDPFGNAPAATSSNDPFAVNNQQQQKSNDPFGGDPFGNQQQKPAQSNDPFGTASNAPPAADPFAGQQPVDLVKHAKEEKQQESNPFAPKTSTSNPAPSGPRPVTVPHKQTAIDPFAPRRKK